MSKVEITGRLTADRGLDTRGSAALLDHRKTAVDSAALLDHRTAVGSAPVLATGSG